MKTDHVPTNRTEALLEAFGEKKTLEQWGDDSRCRVSKEALKRRFLDYDLPFETLISTPPNEIHRKLLLTAWGEKKTRAQWRRDVRCKVSYRTMASRLKQGISPEEALGKEESQAEAQHSRRKEENPMRRSKKDTLRLTAFGEKKTYKEWANDPRCKVDYMTLLNRVTRLKWDAESSITTPAHKKPTRQQKSPPPTIEEACEKYSPPETLQNGDMCSIWTKNLGSLSVQAVDTSNPESKKRTGREVIEALNSFIEEISYCEDTPTQFSFSMVLRESGKFEESSILFALPKTTKELQARSLELWVEESSKGLLLDKEEIKKMSIAEIIALLRGD